MKEDVFVGWPWQGRGGKWIGPEQEGSLDYNDDELKVRRQTFQSLYFWSLAAWSKEKMHARYRS